MWAFAARAASERFHNIPRAVNAIRQRAPNTTGRTIVVQATGVYGTQESPQVVFLLMKPLSHWHVCDPHQHVGKFCERILLGQYTHMFTSSRRICSRWMMHAGACKPKI